MKRARARRESCDKAAIQRASYIASLLNQAGELEGSNLNFVVDEKSIRKINQNRYAVKLTSDHGGPQSYLGRELVLTGKNDRWSCEISLVQVIELKLTSPGVTEWSKVLYRSK